MASAPAVLFQPIAVSSASGLVFEAVRSAMFSGRLRPGAPLREMHLARELQVSQATVREGLLQLEHAGLVTRVANKGTYVLNLSAREVRERCNVRIPLEQYAAAEAARRLRPEDFAALDQQVREISELASENAHRRMAQVDLEFHRAIWKMADNATLYRTLEQVAAPLFHYISMRHSQSGEVLTQVTSPHEPIVEALRRGSREAIQEVIREHTESAYREYIEAAPMPAEVA
jgi:DNA-binding GntR family transcriptional regulator